MRIGIDLDGCLADFNRAYIRVIEEQTGIVLPAVSDTFPAVWNYAEPYVERDKLSKVWDYISHPGSHFWARLDPLPGAPAIVTLLSRSQHDVYYITSRPGVTAKMQSEIWLKGLGVQTPTVLLSNQKGPIAVGLGLDVFIDDRLENCFDVIATQRHPMFKGSSKAAQVYIIDAPYNRKDHYQVIKRVKTVREALLDAGALTNYPVKAAA